MSVATTPLTSAGLEALMTTLLERFETLPFVLGQQHEVADTLAHAGDPDVVARMNASLQAIQRQAKVGALYLMDRKGLTIAASNWDQPLGFVAHTT